MPLQEASPRLPAPRYHQPSKPRHALLENIEELFGMFAVLGALQASTQMLLAVAPSASMVCLFVQCFALGTRGGGHVFSAPAAGC